jgi:hypothetical protein
VYCIREILNSMPVVASDAPFGAQIARQFGRVLSFRNPVGQELKILLPSQLPDFAPLTRHCEETANGLLASWDGWARIYRVVEDPEQFFEVLAVAEETDVPAPVFRTTFSRRLLGKREHFRKYPAQVIRAEMMSIAALQDLLSGIIKTGRCDVGLRSDRIRGPRERVAWFGPLYIGDTHIEGELKVIAELFGVDLTPYWSSQNPIDAYKKFVGSGIRYSGMFIWRSHARKLSSGLENHAVQNDILFDICDESAAAEMLEELKLWLEIDLKPLAAQRQLSSSAVTLDETEESYLAFMIHSMDIHHKLAVCNHCNLEQATTPIRGRNGNVAWAAEILQDNSEQYREKAKSNAIFLRKERGTEVKYFVNRNALAKANELLRKAGFPETYNRNSE